MKFYGHQTTGGDYINCCRNFLKEDGGWLKLNVFFSGTSVFYLLTLRQFNKYGHTDCTQCL